MNDLSLKAKRILLSNNRQVGQSARNLRDILEANRAVEGLSDGKMKDWFVTVLNDLVVRQGEINRGLGLSYVDVPFRKG